MIISLWILFFVFFGTTSNVLGYTIRRQRVLNDHATKPGQFPHQAMLIGYLSKGRILCGGSLLDNEWIVTAGHCLTGVREFDVHLGAQIFNDTSEPERVILKTSKFIRHEKFSPVTAANDIALVKLSKKVKFTNRIRPARLPSSKDTYEGQIAIATGWGLEVSSTSKVAPQLQYTELKVITNQDCKQSFNPLIIRESTLCAKGESNESVCSGDSGGPLILKDSKVLVGITSFGHVNGCEFGFPGGFTRITAYVDWITLKTGIKPARVFG